MSFGDCISENKNIYVGLTLSSWLRMHRSDTSSISQHLNKDFCSTTEFQKILAQNTTILEQQDSKQRLRILKALHARNKSPNLNKINFESSANLLKCL